MRSKRTEQTLELTVFEWTVSFVNVREIDREIFGSERRNPIKQLSFDCQMFVAFVVA